MGCKLFRDLTMENLLKFIVKFRIDLFILHAIAPSALKYMENKSIKLNWQASIKLF